MGEVGTGEVGGCAVHHGVCSTAPAATSDAMRASSMPKYALRVPSLTLGTFFAWSSGHAIAMLNVSATQQIKKEKDAEVKALQDENAAQTKQIAALEQRLAAQEQQFAELKASEKVRETKLAAIEKLLEAAVSTGSTARTVSLKTASAK